MRFVYPVPGTKGLKKARGTNETIIDGRFRTGDVGYLDEDGYTFIIDRIKDLVLVNGFNFIPVMSKKVFISTSL